MKTLRRYTDLALWWRSARREAVHNGVGAILALVGTNGIEASTPPSLQGYVSGIGLTFEQAVSVFVVTFALTLLRAVHTATAPREEINHSPRIPSDIAN